MFEKNINASFNPVLHLWLPTVSFLGTPPPSLLRFWATPPSPILDPRSISGPRSISAPRSISGSPRLHFWTHRPTGFPKEEARTWPVIEGGEMMPACLPYLVILALLGNLYRKTSSHLVARKGKVG